MAHNLISKVIDDHLGKETNIFEIKSVGGGCINQTIKISTDKGDYFLKHNTSQPEMFEKEAKGLALLSVGKNLKLPKVFGYGIMSGVGYLLLEFIQKGRETSSYWSNLGQGLAMLHQQNTSMQFGLDHDNFIGRLTQSNTFDKDWCSFFITKRLQPQIDLAKKKNIIDASLIKQFEKLFPLLPEILPEEKPALLHGDLWSGNVMPTLDETPCIYDPAVYFGHREAELSFTLLFGGFNERFYDVYNHHYPLVNDFNSRVDLYNLYPLLVHVNLFGTSYLSGIRSTLKRFN